MTGREKRTPLGHCLEEGRGKSAIARKLGISRDTIHRPIRTGELDRNLGEEPVRHRAPRGGDVRLARASSPTSDGRIRPVSTERWMEGAIRQGARIAQDRGCAYRNASR